jgi:hypothetical protein
MHTNLKSLSFCLYPFPKPLGIVAKPSSSAMASLSFGNPELTSTLFKLSLILLHLILFRMALLSFDL